MMIRPPGAWLFLHVLNQAYRRRPVELQKVWNRIQLQRSAVGDERMQGPLGALGCCIKNKGAVAGLPRMRGGFTELPTPAPH
jgi:hypothetical protein